MKRALFRATRYGGGLWRSGRLGWIKRPFFRMICTYLEPKSFTFYLFFPISADNPLICDCDLRWYRDWLKELRHKDDDDIIQKKHILCLMEEEHRFVTFLFVTFYTIIILRLIGKRWPGPDLGLADILFLIMSWYFKHWKLSLYWYCNKVVTLPLASLIWICGRVLALTLI